MIRVTIIYHATGIRVDFTPGNPNFSYWLGKKIDTSRWHGKKDGTNTVVIDITDEEAEYIEQLAKAQRESGDQVRLEVIGTPVPAANAGTIAKKTEPEPENRQMRLF